MPCVEAHKQTWPSSAHSPPTLPSSPPAPHLQVPQVHAVVLGSADDVFAVGDGEGGEDAVLAVLVASVRLQALARGVVPQALEGREGKSAERGGEGQRCYGTFSTGRGEKKEGGTQEEGSTYMHSSCSRFQDARIASVQQNPSMLAKAMQLVASHCGTPTCTLARVFPDARNDSVGWMDAWAKRPGGA